MKKILLFLLILSSGCNKSNTILSSSEVLKGTYIAKSYDGFIMESYPINGKTFSMQIDVVSADTVHVLISSTENGFYSPGDTLINLNAFVYKRNCTNCQYTTTYQISLGTQIFPGTLDNTIWFDAKNNAYYTYIPPNFTKGDVQTIMVKTN